MKISLNGRKAIAGFAFVSPFIIGLLIIFVPSFIRAIAFSFSDIHVTMEGYTLESVGLQYYKKALLENAWYTQELVNSIWKMLLNVPLIIAFSFFIAGILNQKFRGRTLVRAVLFLPVVITAGVVAKLDNLDMLNGLAQSEQAAEVISSIDLSNLFLKLGLSRTVVSYITTAVSQIYQIITDSGVQILIFLSALQTIPSSLYEVSSMEGASGWENFWKITFPMISPFILVNAVYSIIDSLASYKSPVMKVITDTAQGQQANMSYSIAMAFMFFLVVVVILSIFVFLISRIVFYYD